MIMEISARNSLKGMVKSVVPGVVNTEVVIEVAPGLEITSIITKASAERLGLEVGGTAYAVVKSSDVMVAVD
jgi:molybdopterin-binding protein